MITDLFLRGRGRERMSATDVQALEDSVEDVRTLGPRQLLVERGREVQNSTLLLEGLMCRYMDDREGHRQIVAFHVPGDFVDLHGFTMKRLDHDIGTLTPVRYGVVPHARLTTVTESWPRLTRLLWFSTLLDAAMHREWIFRLGRLGAEGRVAHMFCELHARMAMIERVTDGSFTLPVTQVDIAEACGLTSVHVNRVLRSLRERNALTFKGGVARILDLKVLETLSEFDPLYLYGSDVEPGAG